LCPATGCVGTGNYFGQQFAQDLQVAVQVQWDDREGFHDGEEVGGKLLVFESPEHLRHSGPADTEVPGQCGTILELAGAKQRLVMVGQLQWITAFCLSGRNRRFRLAGTVPGQESDHGLSM
jgi:hypothetical protein